MRAKRIGIVVGLVAAALAMVGLAQLTGGNDGNGALALGATAVVEYSQAESGGAPGPPTRLAITVTAVRRGTQEQLAQAGLKVDPEDRSATPHYVDARFENRGGETVKREMSVSLEDEDGDSLPRTLVFGFGGKPFERCREVTEGTLAPGQAYESCTLVLVPEGRDVGTVLFVSQEADSEIRFTRWDASAP